MHEGHFTEQIVDAVLAELNKYPGRKIRSVRVKVGEAYHLAPESLLMHYAMITEGTALQGVQLDLVEEPMDVLCGACGKQGPVEDHHLLVCSFCHSRQVKAISGDKVTIEEVALEP